jgi:hypothetical protein
MEKYRNPNVPDSSLTETERELRALYCEWANDEIPYTALSATDLAKRCKYKNQLSEDFSLNETDDPNSGKTIFTQSDHEMLKSIGVYNTKQKIGDEIVQKKEGRKVGFSKTPLAKMQHLMLPTTIITFEKLLKMEDMKTMKDISGTLQLAVCEERPGNQTQIDTHWKQSGEHLCKGCWLVHFLQLFVSFI